MPAAIKNVLNIADLRDLARKRLTKALFDFCDKGSEDQINMRANRIALDNIKAYAPHVAGCLSTGSRHQFIWKKACDASH